MKKFLSVILISMLVLTCAFAASPGGTTTANQSQKDWEKGSASVPDSQVKVSLTVDPAKMHTYAFGFTNEADGGAAKMPTNDFEVGSLPDAAGTELALDYRAATSKADNVDKPLFFYYKIRNNSQVLLTITISDTLTAVSGDTSTQLNLNWQVKGTKTAASSDDQVASFTLSSAGDKSADITVAQPTGQNGNTNLKWLACRLDITTDPISSLLTKATKYEGTITVGVKPVR